MVWVNCLTVSHWCRKLGGGGGELGACAPPSFSLCHTHSICPVLQIQKPCPPPPPNQQVFPTPLYQCVSRSVTEKWCQRSLIKSIYFVRTFQFQDMQWTFLDICVRSPADFTLLDTLLCVTRYVALPSMVPVNKLLFQWVLAPLNHIWKMKIVRIKRDTFYLH